MDPTLEQQAAVDFFKTGENLVVEAGAGTGKTSTLVMLAEAAGKRNGQYVAFNKALVQDAAGKFPFSVVCNTAHSLAFQAYGKRFRQRLNSSYRVPSREIAARLGIERGLDLFTFRGEPKYVYPGFVAGQVSKAVTKFCQTADEKPRPGHVPYVHGLDSASNFILQQEVYPLAQQMWNDVDAEHGYKFPYKHEHYLKGWQLRNPRIQADFILFDEAQDANPVIADIIAQQAHYGVQLVYVGDSQQEIYGWTGAINALSEVEVKHRTFLTQSFRFGQAIADRANVVLEGLDAALRLTGNPAIDSRVGEVPEPRAILVRKNATGITMLLKMQEEGRKAHFVGGTTDVKAFAEGAQSLMEQGRSSHPDLMMFKSWAEVQQYVQDEDESGEDLKLNVKLVDTFGPEAIVAAIDKMPDDKRADITISTAHRSKGREWKSVSLAGDFPVNADSDPSDRRLLYVALTRAKLELDDSVLAAGQEALA